MSRVQDVAGEALRFLAATDEDAARTKAHMKGIEYKVKKILHTQKLESKATSATMKETEAYASSEYDAITEAHKDAIYEYEILSAKRATQTLRFEWARSMNANRRQGGSV